jgi:hypothetical protein
MLSRYAHIRAQAKRAAIATLDEVSTTEAKPENSAGDSPQKPPQSAKVILDQALASDGKLLN